MRFIWIQILIFCFSMPTYAQCENNIALVSGKPDYPPISWTRHNKLSGIGYMVLKEILSQLNIQMFKAEPRPWKRALNLAEEGEIDILVGTREIDERSQYLDFVTTPIIESAQNIFFMKGAKIDSLDDLPGKVGGILLGTTYTKQFNEFATKNLKFEPVNTQIQNIQKLELGRIDYFIAPLLPTIHYIRTNNLNLNIQFLALPVFTVQERIAISKKSTCIKYLKKIDEHLKQLHEQNFVYDLFDEQTQEWDVLEYMK